MMSLHTAFSLDFPSFSIRLGQIPFLVRTALSAAASQPAGAKQTARDHDAVNRAAERLFDLYGNSILRLAYSYLHNMSDAEEILQETLLQFLNKAPVFENNAHEKSWLLQVAANLSKNRIEYNRLRSSDVLRETLIAEQREDLSFLWDAVRQLPDRYREVIHLFYYEGYTTAQIARILKKNESTIRSCLHRGREKLKQNLKEDYDFGNAL